MRQSLVIFVRIGRKLHRGLRHLIARLALVDWRRETIYPLTAAMEVAWITPWYLALIPATSRLPPARTAIGLLTVMVIPVYAARATGRLYLKPHVQQAVLATLLVLTCVLSMRVILYSGQEYTGFSWLTVPLKDVLNVYQTIPDWFVIVLSTLFLWWRGISLGQRRPSVAAVNLGFYVGIVSFIGFVVTITVITDQDPSYFVPVFFFCSLMALAASRMEEMRGLRGALRSPFGFFWLTAIASSAFAVILLGTLFGALLTGSDLQAVVYWIEPLLLIVGVVLGLMLLVLRTVVNFMLGISRSLGLEGTSRPLADLLEGLGDLLPEGSPPTVDAPPGVTTTIGIVRLVLIVGLVVGLGMLLIWLLRRQINARRERIGEDHESILSSDLLLQSLRQLKYTGRGRLASLLGLTGRSGWRRLFAALTVRRIYAQMLRLAATQGYSRVMSQTPYEYESTAARVFPDATSEVHRITEAYVAVHYGEVPETEAELQEIRACWHRLKESLRSRSTDLP